MSQFNSSALGRAPSYYFSLQCNSCNIFNHKSPHSPPVPRTIYFFPSHWPPLPSITDCLCHHLSFPLIPSSRQQPYNTIAEIHHSTIVLILLWFSLSPLPPPSAPLALPSLLSFYDFHSSSPLISLPSNLSPKAAHGLAAAEEVASLQTRKIHLEQPSAVSLPLSELS